MVKAYNATYVKSSGESREMNFIRLNDLPETFLNGMIKGTGKERSLREGQEVVWDIDNDGFRMFNWKTIVGESKTYQSDRFEGGDNGNG